MIFSFISLFCRKKACSGGATERMTGVSILSTVRIDFTPGDDLGPSRGYYRDMRILILGLLLVPLIPAFGATTCESKGPNVILFTWDGIRGHEVFQKKESILHDLWTRHLKKGVLLGGKRNYRIASDIAKSLPSYQAILTGQMTNCHDNNCPSVTVPTVLEEVRGRLDLEKKDVAIFASWNRLSRAAATRLESITHGIFPEIFSDGTNDSTISALQAQGMRDLPDWQGSRKDQYTYALATHYLKKHCPRLLYISLVDSDEFGHAGDYPSYVKSMKTYDRYLTELIDQLGSMGDYGRNTTLIVTTDHSRGWGPFWRGHGMLHNSEKRVFLFAYGRGVKSSGTSWGYLPLGPSCPDLKSPKNFFAHTF
jgi:hypothetical protein